MLEKTLYPKLIRGAALRGLCLLRLADGSFGKKPSDIYGVSTDGIFVSVEVKKTDAVGSPDGPDWFMKKLSMHQKYWAEYFAKSCALSLVVVASETTGKVWGYNVGTGTIAELSYRDAQTLVFPEELIQRRLWTTTQSA